MTKFDFNLIKLTFGITVIIGFFMVIMALLIFPDVKSDLIMVLVGQLSAGFILVLRHVFQAKPTNTTEVKA